MTQIWFVAHFNTLKQKDRLFWKEIFLIYLKKQPSLSFIAHFDTLKQK